ncbi:GAF domain-containing protein [Streptomyces sp. NPDC059002]|uniref:GAF domain-containing protein n=1 Tax=Streptomyces sp. NPDC059002 TaxID=3346690 RepID=UPI003699F0AF
MAQETLAAPPVPEFTDIEADFVTPGEVLDVLAQVTAAALCGTAAGVSLLDGQGQLRYVMALGLAATDLECVQERDRVGPGIDAVRTGALVAAKDLTGSDGRWSRYGQRLLAHGLVSVTALPMELDGTVLGTLSVYDSAPRDWSADDHATARALVRTALVQLCPGHAGGPPYDVWSGIEAAYSV